VAFCFIPGAGHHHKNDASCSGTPFRQNQEPILWLEVTMTRVACALCVEFKILQTYFEKRSSIRWRRSCKFRSCRNCSKINKL
jgi:hypothetical protein